MAVRLEAVARLGARLANQGLWLWSIIAFQVWGLVPLTVALTVIYTRNLIRWRREERTLAGPLPAAADALQPGHAAAGPGYAEARP